MLHPYLNRTIFLIEDLSQQHLQARSVLAVLHQAGFQTRLLDPSTMDLYSIIALAAQEQPRLIIASVLFADHIDEYLDWFTQLRAAKISTHLTMIGPLPAFAHADLLNACPALDSVLCNEPEATIAQLASTCNDSTQWQKIPGIAFRSPMPHVNPSSPPTHLDDLPFASQSVLASRRATKQSPSWNSEITSSPNASRLLAMTEPLHFATIVASRGCFHTCSFCLPCAFYRAQGAPYRLQSISNVADEIESLYHTGVRLFLFDDEQFLPPRGLREKRIAQFADELRRRDLQIAFTLKCRADDVDESLFRQLRDLGLLRVYIGIESGHQPTLDWMHKKTTVEQNIVALKMLDELGIVANFRTLLLHPWSTPETIHTEINFLQSVLSYIPTLFSFREIEIYKGTPLSDVISSQARNLQVESERFLRTNNAPRNAGHWLISYQIADPRAELLRRLNHIVFASSYKAQDSLDQICFDVLTKRHFHPAQFDTTEIQRLKSVAIETNQFTLNIWREMIAFVERENIFDAERVNKQAGNWARKTKTFQVLAQVTRKV